MRTIIDKYTHAYTTQSTGRYTRYSIMMCTQICAIITTVVFLSRMFLCILMFVFCSDTALLRKCQPSDYGYLFLFSPTIKEGFSIFKEYKYTEAKKICKNPLSSYYAELWFRDTYRTCVQSFITYVKRFYDITAELQYNLWARYPARTQQLLVCVYPGK